MTEAGREAFQHPKVFCAALLENEVIGGSSTTMSENKFCIPAEDIKRLVEHNGGCIATDMITVEGRPVGYMYREPPNNDADMGEHAIELPVKTTASAPFRLRHAGGGAGMAVAEGGN